MARKTPPYASDSLIRQAMLSLPAPLVLVNQDNLVSYMNPEAERLFGITLDHILGHGWSDLVSLQDQSGEPVKLSPMEMKQSTRLPDHQSWWLVKSRQDRVLPVQLSVAPLDDPLTQEQYGLAVVFYELGDIQQLVERLLHQCSHDYLTGLVNRSVFESRLIRAVESAVAGRNSHALMFMDLDNFKMINDRYGHKAGDALLQNIARVFRSIVRERDTLARLGGDEFTLLLEHCDLSHAIKTGDLLRLALQESPLYWQGEVIKTSISIGIVMIDQYSPSPNILFGQADAACYMAKKKLWKHIHVYKQGDAENIFSSTRTGQNLNSIKLNY